MRWLPGSLVPPNTSGGGVYFLNERWVARGLVALTLGGLWLSPGRTVAVTQVGNPALRQGGRYGEATSFGSTLAGNTNSYLVSTERLRYPPSGRRTYFVSFMAHSVTANFNRFFQHNAGSGGDGAGLEGSWALDGAFSYVFSHGSAVAQCKSTATLPLGRWTSAAVSMVLDGTNNWLTYVDGTRTPTIYNQAPAASGNQVPQISTIVAVGNRPSDSLRSFDGQIGVQAWFDTVLTDAEIASLHANPNQLLVSSDRGVWAPAVSTVVVYRPGTDITTTDWTAVPGPGFYTAIDEDVASNTDYIQSPNRATPDDRPFEAGLSGTMPAGTWDVSIRTERLAGIMGVRVELMDGITVTGTAQTNITLTGAQDYVIPVTTTANSTKVRIKVYDGGLP